MGGSVNIQFTGEDRVLIQSLTRQVAKQEELLAKLRATTNESKRADEATVKWSASMDAVTRHVAGFVSLAAAINAAKYAILEFDRAGKASADQLKSTQETSKKLMQISGGRGPEYAKLKDESEKLSVAAGIPLATAQQTVFGFHSTGTNAADRKTFTEALKYVSPEGAIGLSRSFANLKANYGAAMTGTAEQFMARAIVAAGPSPLDVEDIGMHASLPNISGSAINSSPGMGMAMTSIISIGGPTADESETMLARFQDRVRETPMLRKAALAAPAGMGPLAAAKVLMEMPQAQRDRVLGPEIRAWRGFQVMGKPGTLEKIEELYLKGEAAAMEVGTKDSLHIRSANLYKTDRTDTANLQEDISASEEVLAAGEIGQNEKFQQSILKKLRARDNRLYNANLLGRTGFALSRASYSLTDTLNPSPEDLVSEYTVDSENLRNMGSEERKYYERTNQQMKDMLVEFQAAAKGMTDSMNDAANATKRGGGSAAAAAIDRTD